MKYILFEKSAIEYLAGNDRCQSIEFEFGNTLIDIINGQDTVNRFGNLLVRTDKNGLLFIGPKCEKTFLLIDLEQCGLIEKEKQYDRQLIIFQKAFRTCIRIWEQMPFAFSEKIHQTKSIVFPFVFTDGNRFVIERSPECERLTKRGINRPLLLYKYGKEDAPHGEEIPDNHNLIEGGETYCSNWVEINRDFSEKLNKRSELEGHPLSVVSPSEQCSDNGFAFMNYENQIKKLTENQKLVVNSKDINAPIRIEGPAGTGKTTSMLLRAFSLLSSYKKDNNPIKIAFFSHSESTKEEAEYAFSLLKDSDIFRDPEAEQTICFKTLFQHCIDTIGIKDTQIIERDALEAKQTQRLLIEDALDKVKKQKYKSFKSLLSEELRRVLDFDTDTGRGTLVAMLQHEFAIQIKGRTNGSIDEYYKLPSIPNALPVKGSRDKEFIFNIFNEYQSALKQLNIFDIDDITIQALSTWNAPFWRRKRIDDGFDYLFVDEMHLFNINEQHAFHYLTKDLDQKQVPICFALDYGQAIGDRGNIEKDYIENGFGTAQKSNYNTVFRSSQSITDFCAAVSASGALMFQNDFKDPYKNATSSFTEKEERICKKPELFQYDNDNEMVKSIKNHIDTVKRELCCNNKDIAIISFESSLLTEEKIRQLSGDIAVDFFLLKNRNVTNKENIATQKSKIIISDPNNINGLEFQCVILVGVDDGRVPVTNGVDDVSSNYLRYIAYNQLYLSSSRAKYRLIILGNKLHGKSPCLKYVLQNELLTEQN